MTTDTAALVPVVGRAVDVPGWTDPQLCDRCRRAYDGADEPCPHGGPLCPACVAEGACSECTEEAVGTRWDDEVIDDRRGT